MGEGRNPDRGAGSPPPSRSVEDAWRDAISGREEAAVEFLRDAAMSVWEVLRDNDKVLASNIATAMILAGDLLEEEHHRVENLIRCLIDSIAKGQFQEDQAISLLIEWKKSRMNNPPRSEHEAGATV